MANARNGTIYIGSTSDLVKRVWQHRTGAIEGFTKDWGCRLLVWYEVHDSIEGAQQRELRMKEWKLREIEGFNPEWDDLFDRIALS